MDSEKPSEPDSTTLEKDVRQEFRKDEDVLCLNNKDGCFYLGTIVQVDTIYKKCLVEFLDNTKTWSSFKDLKSFAPQESDICYVCKKSQSKSDNKIVVCKCGRACHQHCHEPIIQNSSITDWKCKICIPTYKRKDEKISKRTSSKFAPSEGPPTSVSQLPYNPDALTWDSHHRINQERRYCYCGENGYWNANMLQCRRCRQWFHSRCTPTVTYPVFCGDRFYVFICSLCNQGKEYSRRLSLKWPDLVHLVLYNLTIVHQTKYYDLEESILPYINDHWDDFHLPPPMAKSTLEERRTNVLNALITCEKRFKCGREIKKRANIWGLRFRGAPKSPPLSLPPRGQIDDNVLKIYCKKNFVTTETEFKPLQNGYINSSEVGQRQVVTVKSEHKLVPPLVINVPKPNSTTMTYTVSDKEIGSKLNDNLTTDTKVISSTEYHGRGLVKRSTPFPPQDQANNLDTRFRSHAVRKARRLLNKNMKRRKKTVPSSVLSSKTDSDTSDDKSLAISQKNFSDSFEEFVHLRKEKMELRKRVTQPEIRKRPQRNLLEARLNSTESKLYNPFVSVDSSDMRKSRNLIQDNSRKSLLIESTPKKSKPLKGKGSDKLKSSKTKYVQKSIYESFNLKVDEKPKLDLLPVSSKYKFKESDHILGTVKSNSIISERGGRSWGCSGSETLDRTHGESDIGMDSTDDETSSRGTLEPFIPTPKDFEGQNNPFRSVTELINTAAGMAPASNPPITLPLPLKTVIPHINPPRLKKRQLSEKDIIIDRNGQVKRRRRHRKNPNGLLTRTLSHGSAAKSAQIMPSKNKKHWVTQGEKQTLQSLNNCVDYALNVRQLRNRDPTKNVEKQIPAVKSTSVKQSPSKEPVNLNEDLESSVKYFFGTASRIANGEKYEIRAKRITFDGRLQCIIDWKSFPT